MSNKLLCIISVACSSTLICAIAQTGDPFTKNVAVIGRDKFGKTDGSGDVWGIKIAGNPDKHYAFATILRLKILL